MTTLDSKRRRTAIKINSIQIFHRVFPPSCAAWILYMTKLQFFIPGQACALSPQPSAGTFLLHFAQF